MAWLALSASGGAACEGLADGPKGRVVSVTDGDTVELDSGLTVRLAGIQAPILSKGRDDVASEPRAEAARQHLETLVKDRSVLLRITGTGRDRHGRRIGQLFLADADGTWVQGRMVAEGQARVYSFADNRACITDLLALEARARAERLGIWADPLYTVRRADRPEQLLQRAGHYELVEGRVLLAQKAGAQVFLNFGRYWKVDFTAVIEARSLRLFTASGLDPLMLEGALVRIRGWVDDRDGPRIEITHPEQIEVLAQQ